MYFDHLLTLKIINFASVMSNIATSLMIRCKLIHLKSATTSFNVLLACKRPLVT